MEEIYLFKERLVNIIYNLNIFPLCLRDNPFFFINVFKGFQDYFARTEKKTKEMMMNSERSFLVGNVANIKRSI